MSRGMAIDYRIVPGRFPNPVVSVAVCYIAVDAAAGGLTTGWWAVVLECFSSHPLMVILGRVPYVLNARNEEYNTVFYSYLPGFVNTFTLNMYVSCRIQGSPGGIRYSNSCGCATGIREYLFNT